MAMEIKHGAPGDEVTVRPYDPSRDLKAIARIWREIGWLGKDVSSKPLANFLRGTRSLVAEIDGAAECLTIASPGTFRYLSEDLPMAGITGVTTGYIARKQGLAGRLTAQLLAEEADGGALVATLGFFEQGYYDRIGFGSGPYVHMIGFDPALLCVTGRPRPPVRVGVKNWRDAHEAMCTRSIGHGGCVLSRPEGVRGEMAFVPGSFGLGYKDGPSGRLSHFFFGAKKAEYGPFHIRLMAWQTQEQLLELLLLLKTLGDQIRCVKMFEPQGLQLQDFLEYPFRQLELTKNSPYAYGVEAAAVWQARILDLPACLARTHLAVATPLCCNLQLADPIADFLATDSQWRGCQGEYILTLGAESQATPGHDPDLPTLRAAVGPFTRLWIGAKSATMLALQPGFSASAVLLQQLDHAFATVPTPNFGWDF